MQLTKCEWCYDPTFYAVKGACIYPRQLFIREAYRAPERTFGAEINGVVLSQKYNGKESYQR